MNVILESADADPHHDSRVDWDWARRSEAERAIIKRYQPTLDESNHGVESFSKVLEAATRGLPLIEVFAHTSSLDATRAL
ncbi:MAG: hypothetical protein ABI175_14800 [Polyangiales bacterium]